MKILILLLTCTALLAETKTEAENRKLREQLAASQAALSAAESRAKRLETGTQKLTDAVAVQAEAGEKIGDKVEEIKGKIDAAQATDRKLAETVQTEAVETRKAARKLVDVVEVKGNATVAALSSQMKEQERTALLDRRKLANDLREANVARDKATADRIAVEEASAIRQGKMQKDLDNLKVTADIIADRKDSRVQGYAFWTMVVMVVLVPLVTIGQIHLTNKVKGVHSIVNGRYSALEEKYMALEKREHDREVLAALHTPPPNVRPE